MGDEADRNLLAQRSAEAAADHAAAPRGRVRVKICGVTSLAEARMAERSGADAVGLLVGRRHAAPDFLEPAAARAIALALPPFLTSVLVTHLEEADELLELAATVPCQVVQVHSDLPARALADLRGRLAPLRVVGKVSIEGSEAIARAREIEDAVDAIVLDSRDRATDRVGGTGMVHDWSISARIVASCSRPVVLAGGLTPENVAEAVRRVRPWAVDVNSGVEAPDGGKSEERVRRFVQAAKGIG